MIRLLETGLRLADLASMSPSIGADHRIGRSSNIRPRAKTKSQKFAMADFIVDSLLEGAEHEDHCRRDS